MWRLIDFGMATPRRDKVKMSGTEILSWEEISGEKYVTKKRRQKKKVGTRAYWSPEQIASASSSMSTADSHLEKILFQLGLMRAHATFLHLVLFYIYRF